MTLGVLWTAMTAIAIVFSAIFGRTEALSAAIFEGAGAAVQLCLEIGGAICLWSALMELGQECGALKVLTRVIKKPLSRLFPSSARSDDIMEPMCANVAANLLGLGNAATPMGIRAAQAMAGESGTSSDELCLFVVINTASIQLIPTTVAAIRQSAGAAAPFDILPAVWLSSLLSLAVGIAVSKLLARLCR